MFHDCPYTNPDLRAPMGMVSYRNISGGSVLWKCSFIILLCRHADGLHLRSFASILMVLSKINRKKKLQKANNRPILLQAKWRINLLIEQKNINFRKLFLRKSHYSLMSYDGTLERNNKLNAPSKWKFTNMVNHQTTFIGIMHVLLYTVFVAYINCLSTRNH